MTPPQDGTGGFFRSFSLGFGAGCVLFVMYMATLFALGRVDMTSIRAGNRAAISPNDPTLARPPLPPANYAGPGKVDAEKRANEPPAGEPARPRSKSRPKSRTRSKVSAGAIKSTQVGSLYDLGIDHLAAGRYDRAINQFNRALGQRNTFAPAYKGLGLAYQKLGNKDMAQAAFSRYLSLSPDAPDADLVRQWIGEK